MKTLKLLPHQIEALNVLADKNRVLIAHDMGLGKTFTGAEKMHELNNAVNLVICQKSKISDWIEHFTDYYPDMTVYNLTKKKRQRPSRVGSVRGSARMK